MISSQRLVGRGATASVLRRRIDGTLRCRSVASRSLVAGAITLRHSFLRQSCALYSTERIIELRSGKSGDHLPKTLYDAANEKENCGVGLIASLKSVPSRSIVEKADEMLVRMAHRGGCGCDPASGDGSGMLSVTCSLTIQASTDGDVDVLFRNLVLILFFLLNQC